MRQDLVRIFSNVFVFDCATGCSFFAGEYIREALRQELGLHEKPVYVADSAKLEEAKRIVVAKRQEGIFSNLPLQGYYIPNQQQINQSTCHELILVVTERCNLRCHYCPYSVSDPQVGHRNHSATDMPVEIAEQGINYFFCHMPSDAYISFYGGEPFLNFKLIKYVVERIKRNLPDQKGLFTLTTNLTIYTPEIGDFLAENGFVLVVSLDGPQTIHDRHRSKVHNKGTYHTVLKNLVDLQGRHPEYCRTHVVSNTVLTQPADIYEIDVYFSRFSQKLAFSRFVVALPVNPGFNLKMGNGEQTMSQAVLKWALKKLEKCSNITEIERSPLLRNFCQQIFKNYSAPYARDQHGLRPFKACIPGQKILLNTDGSLSICDKCETLKIGSINTGLDKGRIQDIIFGWQAVLENDCLKCWASSLCQACYIHSWDGKDFSRQKLHKYCNEFLRKTEQVFPVYLKLKRRFPEISKLLEDADK